MSFHSKTEYEETIIEVRAYSPLTSAAVLTTHSDGTTKIDATVNFMGYHFTLDEVAVLMTALPKAVEKAGALAAKLGLEAKTAGKAEPSKKFTTTVTPLSSVPYEEPVVTPVGNMNDRLSEVCATPHDLHDDEATRPTGLPTEAPDREPPASPAPKPTNCSACAYSGIEPQDMDLTCGHPDAGTFGVHLRVEPAAHCPDRVKFEQHPGRNPDGSLKNTVIPGI